MKCKYLLTLLPALGLCTAISAQPKWETDGNNVIFSSPQGDMRLQLCNDGMIRVTKSPDSAFPEDEDIMVVKYDFEPVDFQVGEAGTEAVVTTSAMKVFVREAPWRIRVENSDGTTVYEEISSTMGQYVNLEAGNTGNSDVGSARGCGPSTECAMRPDEHFFGFGERMDFLDQRGQKVHLNVELGTGPKPAVGGKDILRANYCPVPYFMSTAGYAIFFHTAESTDWDMGWTSRESYTWSAEGGDLDYYFIMGPSPESMIRNYQILTGSSPLMPRSAYGLHVGTYSGGTWKYEECTSDKYPVELVRRLRSEHIPFDILWLDSTWRHFGGFGNGGCSFEFRQTFADPQAMIDSVYAQHVDMLGLHIRAIIDNGLNNTLLNDAVKAGAVFPGAEHEGIINFFDPKAAQWWWDNGVQRVASMGVKFLKTDCGSVLTFAENQPSGSYGTSPAALHNLFPVVYARAPYEKFRDLNGGRGFNHTREGYAGIQRYPFIWAGDWGSEWQWFEPVIRGGLNIALSGVGYWAHCMGGFEQYSPYDTDLYVRWCQFGMLSPVSILFGMDHPRYHEPWTYGQEAMEIFTKYDNLRYSLIPYIYSNAHTMYLTSRPLMTPLLYDWFDDELTYSICDQYMFGPSLMVCPVTVKGALSRPVYFPGGKWIDFWTGERIQGRQHKSFLTPPDLMPIFVRAGAIIPKQPVLQWFDERPVDEITLLVYPDGTSTYDLYEDDGRSLDYMDGIFAVTTVTSREQDGIWELDIARPEGGFTPGAHTYRIEAYWDRRPGRVTQNDLEMNELASESDLSDCEGWFYDEGMGMLLIRSALTNEAPITFNVK